MLFFLRNFLLLLHNNRFFHEDIFEYLKSTILTDFSHTVVEVCVLGLDIAQEGSRKILFQVLVTMVYVILVR